MTDELKGGGAGCVCSAFYYGECLCGADWTDPEIYALRARVKALEEALEYAQNCLVNTGYKNLAELVAKAALEGK